MKMKKKHTALRIIAGITAALVLTGAVYCTFGGFDTGSSADAAEFAKYSSDIASMKVPEGTRIVALGEATHGNREFQELKLDVFRLLVEKYGVRDALLACGEEADFAVHHADILLQNIELGKAYSDPGWEGTALRDKLMAQNIMWISAQEEKLGHECIFVTGHNGHIERNGTYNPLDAKVTGHFLADELGSGYFAVGTDFYRATVNLPGSQKRITRSFYSWDPVAKAAKNCGGDMSYLDFSLIPEDSSLRQAVDEWGFMGSLGESYSFIMKLFPYTYRVWRSPSETYDAAIYVPYAHPTEILPA